ncbi:TPA: hypothetical protein ACP2LJ_000586, partial [Listeria monocytogenes]
ANRDCIIQCFNRGINVFINIRRLSQFGSGFFIFSQKKEQHPKVLPKTSREFRGMDLDVLNNTR